MLIRTTAQIFVAFSVSLMAIGSATAQGIGTAGANPPVESGESAAASVVGEIVVTARRKEESLQSVPVTVTVISPELMQRTEIYDQFSLQAQVPAFANFTRSPGNGNIASFNRIRGVPGVAYQFNETPIQPMQATLYAQYFDLQSIQILKGPQGTLFGQASNAGALLFEPKTPGNELAGYVLTEIGDYGKKNFEAAVDLPFVSDRVMLRLAAKSFFRDGYVTDVISGYRTGKEDYDVYRATLLFKPIDGITNTTMFQAQTVRDLGQPPRTLNAYNLFPSNGLIGLAAAVNGMTVPQFRSAVDYVIAQQNQIGINKYEGWSIGCPASNGRPATQNTVPGPNIANAVPQSCPPGQGTDRDYDFVNKTTASLGGGWQVKNIFGNSWITGQDGIYDSSYDVDHSRLILLESNAKVATGKSRNPVWSDEIQVSGTVLDRTDVIGGVFYTKNMLRASPEYGPIVASVADSATALSRDSKSKAVFGQADHRITPDLTLSAGLRETQDSTVQTTSVLDPATLAVISSSGGPGTPTGDAKWNSLSYNAGLKYQITPATMVYFEHAKGHSAGGLQDLTGHEKFEPDVLKNYEIGLKSTVGIGPLTVRADAAAYYGDYSNVQVQSGIVQGSQILVGTFNAAKGRIKGFELELNASLWDSFSVRAFADYSNAKYTSYPSFDPQTLQPIDLSNTPFQSNPPWKVGLAPTYYLPLDRDRIGEINIGANYTWTAQSWSNVTQPEANPNNLAAGGAICSLARTAANGFGPLSADGKVTYIDCAPARYNIDVSIVWDNVLAKNGLQIGARMTNVTDNKTPSGTSGLWSVVGVSSVDVPYPRMVSVWIKKTF